MLKEADDDYGSLSVKIMNFNKKIEPQNLEKKRKKKDILKNLYELFDC